ncbi:diadenylate cyclase CdaA [Rubrivirga sp. S365]|uniref:Diadenylate cyclase n=1 Tax=Rubrivirga litoralis TaxID=3075598 RepID=A0ABU3BT08_9BACT|nr:MULTISPECIES: diadenylate cyclase CdaA [unclassified Rubrivirga]MDT0632422.1 diadenylate cyclase CdaA [Rubrivirga sp. F394]MDT7855207.1 diadenylate cyclase CdaA [Rubrivirga sp. S365]
MSLVPAPPSALLFLEVFRIGFVPVGWLDLLDIALTAVLVYQGYRLIRGTIAVQVAVALLGIYALSEVVRAIGLTTLNTLFGAVGDVFVLAVLILFAPEIRQALFLLGRNPLVRRLVTQPPRQKITDEVVGALREMSRDRVGSLIAFARSSGLRNYVESGTQIHAEVERDLLTSIFFPNSPLHDGAVIVQGQKIEAARCILPVSDARTLDPHLGLRHRAAVGLTERTDAFVVVTSEETGKISVAENGKLDVDLSLDEVEARFNAAFSPARRDDDEPAPPAP